MPLRRPVLDQRRFFVGMQLTADRHDASFHVDDGLHHIAELALGERRETCARRGSAKNLDRHPTNTRVLPVKRLAAAGRSAVSMAVPNVSSPTVAGSRKRHRARSNTTASAGVRWPCRITNRELYH